MPRLSADVVTTIEVELKPKLLTKLKARLNEYRLKVAEQKVLAADVGARKAELETLFVDAGEYDALESGVSIHTPFGEVPMKIIKGETARKLNLKKVMTKFKITPAQLDSCYDPSTPKKPYLGIYLPRDKDEEGDDE